MYYGRMAMKNLLKLVALLMLLATLCIFFLQTAKWIASYSSLSFLEGLPLNVLARDFIP